VATLLGVLVQQADPNGDDVELLIAELGQRDFFQDRIARQKSGNGVLFIAWSGDRPIGDAYLWMEPAEEPDIRRALPGVPLLTHVEVLADLRSHGVGTELIAAAERELADRGHRRVALAVEETNVRAARLYERCGYRDWDHPRVHCLPYDDGSGRPRPVEICRVMVKDLPAPAR
jgi:GNAT superfamily N-acetyltransferase